MVPTTPLELKRQLHKGPGVCAIRICLDGCKSAYLGVAIGRGVVPNWDRTWQNGASHIDHSVILSYRNPNPNKTDMGREGLPRNKISMTFCSRSGVAHMRNKLRKSPATAYRT